MRSSHLLGNSRAGLVSSTVLLRIEFTATDASTPMYYNKNGGKKYHTNARCSSVKSRYLPLSAITYGDLSSYPYTQLSPCTTCGAPERPEVVSAWNSVIDEAYAELGLTGEK